MSQVHKELAEERLGQVLDAKWRLDRVLGVGGFAAVYAAEHTVVGGWAAIKILHRDVAVSKKSTERLVREARMANLLGAGAVPVRDHGVTEDREPFFVMDLLEGATVEAHRRRAGGQVDAVFALSVADRVLDTLATAHARDIVHRDLKPENLFLTLAGEVKVLDFGLAYCRELRGASETTTGVPFGTATFAPPEQAQGKLGEVDARSDLWALGATTFTLLTGQPVHGALTTPMAWVAAMQKPARPLGEVVPGLPPEVREVVDRALAFEKADRWPDARAMQAAVRAAYAAITAPALPKAGDQRVNPKDGSVLVYVPGGVFTLGADDMSNDERPIHQVRLSPFWIARHPVTNAQYAAFLRERPEQKKAEHWDDARFNGPEQPVVGVSWDEAAAYAAWAGLVLPTEAQWEAAARGGDGRRYPWGNAIPDETRANFGGKVGKTTPVGSYPAGAGPYGTLDQAGNVWEWCHDPWDSGGYAKRVATGQVVVDPVNAGDTAVRAVRGGSWGGGPGDLAAACRDGGGAGGRYRRRGFRCAWSSSPPSTVGA